MVDSLSQVDIAFLSLSLFFNDGENSHVSKGFFLRAISSLSVERKPAAELTKYL